MTRRPREPLSLADAALAARLRSLHAQAEPGPGVDAHILAAARGAAEAPVATGRRVGWLAPVAVAAALSLAVGLAWRLQPAVAPVADAAPVTVMATPPQAPDADRTSEAPAPSLPPPAQPAPASKAVAPPPRAAERPRSPAPPAPPSPPTAPVVESAAADMGVAAAPAPASPVAAAASSATDNVRERATTADTAPASTKQATRATQAVAREATAFPADPGEEVPPATVESPEVRQAWLLRIGELLQDGRVDEARASLAEFRRRYPEAPLPPELRALEP